MNAALTGVYDVLGDQSLYGNSMFTTLNAASDLSFYRRNNISSGTQVLNYDASDGYSEYVGVIVLRYPPGKPGADQY